MKNTKRALDLLKEIVEKWPHCVQKGDALKMIQEAKCEVEDVEMDREEAIEDPR